jgi:hypothetical protein
VVFDPDEPEPPEGAGAPSLPPDEVEELSDVAVLELPESLELLSLAFDFEPSLLPFFA